MYSTSTGNRPVALISGAGSGIGAATALRLASRGVRVVVGYLPGDSHSPEPILERIKSSGGEAIALPVDVSSTAQVNDFVSEAAVRLGRVDYAVANAGLLRRSTFNDLSDEKWNEVIEVDLTGVLRLFRASVNVMSQGGALVAVSSISGGVYGWSEHAHYAAAKAGILGLVRSAAVELAPVGIRANTVIPGIIRTPQSLDAKNSLGPDGLESARSLIPMGRVGDPDEVAAVIEFLTVGDSTYVTGQEFTVDGGLTVKQAS